MEPTLEALRSEGWDIEKIDVDGAPDRAAEARVLSVPTFVILRDGVPVKRLIGAQKKSQLEVEFKAAAGG